MKIIRTEKQRENLAKYFWDMSKVAFAVLVAGPFAKPESFSSAGLVVGVVIGFLLALRVIFLTVWRCPNEPIYYSAYYSRRHCRSWTLHRSL